MRIRRAMLAVGAMATVGVAVQAAPAAAGTCPYGYVCMFEDAGYRGDMYVRKPGNVGLYEIDWWNGDNEISSVLNFSNRCVRLYDNDGWSGGTYFIDYDTVHSTLPGFDNRAESFMIYAC